MKCSWLLCWALVLAGCPGTATLGSRVEAEAVAPVEIERLGTGARVVEWSRPGREQELVVLMVAEPELEPLGLEGAMGLLVELSLEAAGEPGAGRDEASPRARALALGGRLEVVADGALIGWRLVLMPCAACGPGEPGEALRLERAWELLLDVALLPELPASTVTRRAEQLRDRLLARVDTMERAAWRWAAALAVGIGRPAGAGPTEEAAANVHREALVRLHRSVVSPERMVLVGPGLSERTKGRLRTLEPVTRRRVECPAPPQLAFGLAGAGAVNAVEARRAPGLGVMGRDALEDALMAARRDPVLGRRRVELVDLGGSAALVDGGAGSEQSLEAWLLAAQDLAATREAETAAARDALGVARDVLFGSAAPGAVTLGQLVTVWWGEAERFPTLPVMLPREAPVCRGR